MQELNKESKKKYVMFTSVLEQTSFFPDILTNLWHWWCQYTNKDKKYVMAVKNFSFSILWTETMNKIKYQECVLDPSVTTKRVSPSAFNDVRLIPER